MSRLAALLASLRGRRAPVAHDGAARWHDAQQLFEQALALEPAERARFMERAARRDAALRSDVESLLAAHDRAGPLDDTLDAWIEPHARPGVAPGDSIGRYGIREQLGAGGMGVVYSAHDVRLGREVALKFLPPHLGASAVAKQRFLIEAQAAAALDHPNICTVHEIGETAAGQLFIAMPRYDGETLKQRIMRGPLGVEEAVDLLIQAARGLAKAHDRGIVHRDIKPANLIVTADGVLKIVDFGIAKLADVTITRGAGAQGTVAYMSPEHARGEAVDGRSDIWSLGIVLYELLTGERPFRAATDALMPAAITHAPLPPLELADDSPAFPIERILRQALARAPAERYASATDLIRELERYLAERARHLRAGGATAAAGVTPVEDGSVSPDGERRPVTVVIASISGYAGLIERLAPDQLDELAGRLRDAAEEIATRHGGVLNEFREDELVLLFGLPSAREDHCVHAVRAALELQDCVRGLRHAHGRANPDLRLHTGIDTGPIVARAAQPGGARYHAAGAALQVARRLAAHAAADEVWISPDCHRVAGPFFDTEARPPVSVRAPAGAVNPRRVIRHTGARSRLDAALRTGLTTYVGRDAQLAVLEDALAQAVSGAGRLVPVTGEAGLGKSRLLYEFRDRVRDRGVQLLTGRCQTHGSAAAYLPFAEVLRSCFGLRERERGPAAAHTVVQRAHAIAPELREFVPLYLQLLSIDSAEHPVPEHLHGDQLRLAIQEALAALLTLGARAAPVVLLLDDWHWADEASQAALEQVIEVAGDCALLAVVTSRTDVHWRAPAQPRTIILEPLPIEAASSMLCSIANVATFPPDIATLLHVRTGGNPFFLEEICQALLEDGTLRVDDGVVRLTGPLDALQLPDTVQAVIHTRLERLERESRELIRLAAVIGREFSRGVLERALPNHGRLPNALQALKAAGLVQQVRIVPDAVFRFKHVLTQEVAYGSLLEHQRRELHARVAAAIEAAGEGGLHDQLQQLAHHHSRAEHWRQAIDYGIRAADRLQALSEFSEALQQLDRCEEWLERSRADAADTVRVDILLRQERLYETLGLRAKQQELIDRLIALLETDASGSADPARLAEVYLRQGDLFTLLRMFDRAEPALLRSLQLRRRLHDAVGERNTLRSLGLLHWHRGSHADGLSALEEALALDRARGDVSGLVGDLVGKAAVLKAMGDVAAARDVLEQALALSERELAVDPELPGGLKLVYILHHLGNVHRELGDTAAALAYFARAIETTEHKHLPVQGSYNRMSYAHILLQQGRIDDSVAMYRTAVSVAQRARYSPGLSQALSALGEVLLGLGRPDEALPHLEQATSLFIQLRDDMATARMWTMRARAHEQLAQAEAARDCFTRARELYRTLHVAAGELEAAEALARVTRAAGADAEPLYREALTLAVRHDDGAAEARIRNTLGIMAWNRGEPAAALPEYTRAVALLRTIGDAATLGLALNSLAVTLLRLARFDDAAPVIDEALHTHRTSGNVILQAHALTAAGELAEARALHRDARQHYEASRALRERAGDRAGAGWMLHRSARVAAHSSQAEAGLLLERARRIALDTGDTELYDACTRPDPSPASTETRHATLHHRT